MINTRPKECADIVSDMEAMLPNVIGNLGMDNRSTSLINPDRMFEGFGIKGYLAEHQRMLNIDSFCGHTRFNSKDAFCNLVVKQIQSFIHKPNDKTAVDLVMLHHQIKDGWCDACSVGITCNLPLVKMHYLKRISQYVIIGTLCNLYTNSMQHFPITKHYLFRKKEYTQYIFKLFVCLLNCDIMKMEQPGIYYQSITGLGFQIIRHLGFLHNAHWKQLLIEPTLIDTLISRIKIELLSKVLNDTIRTWCRTAVAVLCYLFMNLIHQYPLVNEKFNIKKVTATLKDDLIQIRSKLTRRIMKCYNSGTKDALHYPFNIWIQQKQKFINICMSEIEMFNLKMIHPLICFANSILQSTDRNQFILIIMENRKQLRKAKFDNIKCQYSECKNSRRIHKQNDKRFLKCSRCNVFKYCSKKCGKKDWKRGKHRLLCNQYI
eukprot:427875_1